MEWNRNKCLVLIELYHTYPELWDSEDINYKNKFKKQEAWSKISEAINEERHEAERKIKNLIGQFSREMKRIRDSKMVNTGGRYYESKWFAFESLQFLNGRMKVQRKSKDQGDEAYYISSADESDTTEDIKIEDSYTLLKNETESIPSISRVETFSKKVKEDEVVSAKLDKLQEKPTPKRKFNERPDDDYGMQPVSQTPSTRDEYCVFGEYVACKVRKLASSYARCTVQHYINTILWEADLGKYDNT